MKCDRIYLKDYFPELGENGCNAYVDYFIPEAIQAEGLKEKAYPCMVVCPGGGYRFVSDRESEVIGTQFLSESYRVFVITYSVKPHSFPQQLREVAGVMELIHRYAKEWQIDTEKIAIIGFSAGGHLAAQYSNRYDCPEVREIFPESKPVQASILSYAVLTANEKYRHAGSIRNFVGHEDPVEVTEKGCSCELLVSEKTPQTFLWHTAEDKSVPVENSLFYARALSEHKIPFELHIYPYGEHGASLANEQVYAKEVDARLAHAQGWVTDVKSWLKVIGF